MSIEETLASLKPKQQKLLNHIPHKVVLDAIIYKAGAEGILGVIRALEKKPESERAEFCAQYVEFARQLAREDLYFLNYYVLENGVVMDDFHHEMCEPSGKRYELDLWPREHMKSTLLTEGRAVQRILQNPDIRILIVNEVLDNARGFLLKIEQYFRANEPLRFLFGDWVGFPWNQDQMVVKARRKILKEPTVAIGSLEHPKVSQHYDLIIADDVVGPTNIGTPDQIAKVQRFFSGLEDLLDKQNGCLSIIGTRWHYNDYYGTVIEKFGTGKDWETRATDPDWRIRVRSIYKPSGAILFPTRFSEKRIEYLKKSKGPYDFGCQYLNQPVSNEDADFKQDWWESCKYRRGEFPQNMRIVITCDPASSNKTSSDYTVYMVVGQDGDKGDWWLVDMIRDRLNPKQRVDTLFNLYTKWKLVSPYLKVGVETVGFQETMKFYAQEQMREQGVHFQIIDLKPKNARKEDRIRSLVPRFANTALHIPDSFHYKDVNGQDTDLAATLKDEFDYFPVSKHDDMMDCLAYVNQIMPPHTGGAAKSGVPSAFPADWLSKLVKGEIFWDEVQDHTGLRKEEIEAYVRDAKAMGRYQ